jgi:hypothetical protein
MIIGDKIIIANKFAIALDQDAPYGYNANAFAIAKESILKTPSRN